MSAPAGSFIWYELVTPDPDASARFYGPVIGWTVSASVPLPDGMDYRMIERSDGGMAGGVMHLTEEMKSGGGRPVWLGYLQAADVDAKVAAITAEGGGVLMPPTTIDGVGRIALITDPQGVPIYLMDPQPDPANPDAASDVFSPDAEQRVCWNELASPDLAGSKAFYAKHFGFEFNNSMPMGEMGDYCFIDHGGMTIGAMMQHQPGGMPPIWLYYFRVLDIEAGKAAVEANGGTVMMGPHEVPGGDKIIVASDPNGAIFGLVAKQGG